MNPDCVGSFKTGISIAILNQFGGIVSSSYCCAFVCVFVFSALRFVAKQWGKVSDSCLLKYVPQDYYQK